MNFVWWFHRAALLFGAPFRRKCYLYCIENIFNVSLCCNGNVIKYIAQYTAQHKLCAQASWQAHIYALRFIASDGGVKSH